MSGTAGADLFDAGAAGGVHTGGAGRDLHVLEAGDGPVAVAGFAGRADKPVFIDFGRADAAAAQATAGGAAGPLVTHGDGAGNGGAVFLQGVTSLAERDLAFG